MTWLDPFHPISNPHPPPAMPHMCHLAESKPSSGFAAKRDASQTLYWAKASHPVSPQPPEPLAHDGIPGRPWCSKCTSVPKAPPSMLMQKPTEVISVRGPGTSGPIMDPLPGATALEEQNLTRHLPSSFLGSTSGIPCPPGWRGRQARNWSIRRE